MESSLERIAIALERIAEAIEEAIAQPSPPPGSPPPGSPPPPRGPTENPIPCMDGPLRLRSLSRSRTPPPPRGSVAVTLRTPPPPLRLGDTMPDGSRHVSRDTADSRALARSTTATTVWGLGGEEERWHDPRRRRLYGVSESAAILTLYGVSEARQ